MSDPIWVAVILALALLGMTGIICYTWWRIERSPAPIALRDPAPEEVASLAGLWTHTFRPKDEQYEYSKTEIKTLPGEEAPQEESPLPIDKDNPPQVKVYNPRPGSTHTPPNCECHKRPVKPGQRVMFWPVSGGMVKVFCMKEDL
jgi:hypothetical protein